VGQKEQPAADGTGDGSSAGEAAPDAPVWHTSGQQRFYVRDDLLFWEAHGLITVQDLQTFFEQRTALQRRRGRVFLLVDARDFAGIPAEARKYAIQFNPGTPLRGAIVVFGSGLIIRTAVSLILAAGRLLGRRDVTNVFFVTDEVEGRALLDRERLALDATQPPL
jgi:hypothetical protein